MRNPDIPHRSRNGLSGPDFPALREQNRAERQQVQRRAAVEAALTAEQHVRIKQTGYFIEGARKLQLQNPGVSRFSLPDLALYASKEDPNFEPALTFVEKLKLAIVERRQSQEAAQQLRSRFETEHSKAYLHEDYVARKIATDLSRRTIDPMFEQVDAREDYTHGYGKEPNQDGYNYIVIDTTVPSDPFADI